MIDDALDLPRDESGRVVGFGVGKEAAMRDWRHRKEERDFAKLVNRLRVRRWVRENPERRRTYAREYARLPDQLEKRRAWKAKRRAKLRRETVYTCESCGSQWCRVPWMQPRSNTRFCSNRCVKRAARAAEGRRKALEAVPRACSECGVTHARRSLYCSDACRLRAKYHAKNSGARRIARRSGRPS